MGGGGGTKSQIRNPIFSARLRTEAYNDVNVLNDAERELFSVVDAVCFLGVLVFTQSVGCVPVRVGVTQQLLNPEFKCDEL